MGNFGSLKKCSVFVNLGISNNLHALSGEY